MDCLEQLVVIYQLLLSLIWRGSLGETSFHEPLMKSWCLTGQAEHKDFLDWLENQQLRNSYLRVGGLVQKRPCPQVCLDGTCCTFSIFGFLDSVFDYQGMYVPGLVNHAVPAGEAHLKALEIAREINDKVVIYRCLFNFLEQ